MKKFKFTKGFTLIELLVVIAIIGILGAIIYAPFQAARRKGRDAQRVIEIKNLISSLTLYADGHNGFYPCDLQVLQDSQSDPLPLASNLGTVDGANVDNLKYNYIAYSDGIADTRVDSGNASKCPKRIVGFHLWTHLETPSAAISGAAKCRGVNTVSGTFSTTSCINLTNTTDNLYNGTEPVLAKAKFLPSERTADTEKSCATDLSSCILDYRQ